MKLFLNQGFYFSIIIFFSNGKLLAWCCLREFHENLIIFSTYHSQSISRLSITRWCVFYLPVCLLHEASGLFLCGSQSLDLSWEIEGSVCIWAWGEMTDMCLMLHEVDSQSVRCLQRGKKKKERWLMISMKSWIQRVCYWPAVRKCC